eukprot:scaffold18580_cov106-Isochrysis_galbana.AAC.2
MGAVRYVRKVFAGWGCRAVPRARLFDHHAHHAPWRTSTLPFAPPLSTPPPLYFGAVANPPTIPPASIPVRSFPSTSPSRRPTLPALATPAPPPPRPPPGPWPTSPLVRSCAGRSAVCSGTWRWMTRGDRCCGEGRSTAGGGGGGSAPDGTFRYGVFAHNASGMPAMLELSFEGADGARSLLLPPHSLLSASRLVPPQGISFFPPPPDAPLRPPRECRLPPAVLLRSRAHGTFLAAHGQDASLVYQSEIPEGGQPGTWEVWRPVETSPRAWRLLSVHGTLLGVNADRQLVQLDGSNALAALELTIFFFDDGSVGLCGDLGNVHMPARKRLGAGWGLPRLRQCAFGAWEALEAIPAHI